MKIKKYYRTLKNGDKSIYVDIYYNQHKRVRKRLDLRIIKSKDPRIKQQNRETEQLAESYIAKLRIEIQNEAFGFIPSFRRQANFVEYFKKQVDLRPPDRSSWLCTYKKLQKFTEGSILFEEIDVIWLEQFQKFLLSEVGQNTAHHYYSNLRYCLNKAFKEKIISSNPCLQLSNIKKRNVKKEYLTESEIITLSNAKCPKPEVKKAFFFSCFTGLRYSDTVNLKWENIKEGNRIEYRQQKTKSIEYFPLSKSALKILSSIKENKIIPITGKVFQLPNKVAVHKAIKSWVREAGINKNVSYNTSRHTFATLSLTSGIDLFTVSKLLGHKNFSITLVYANIIDEKRKQEISKLPFMEVTQ